MTSESCRRSAVPFPDPPAAPSWCSDKRILRSRRTRSYTGSSKGSFTSWATGRRPPFSGRGESPSHACPIVRFRHPECKPGGSVSPACPACAEGTGRTPARTSPDGGGFNGKKPTRRDGWAWVIPTDCSAASPGLGDADADRGGHLQVGLVHPAAGVGGAVPALQRHGGDVLAFLVVEQLQERLGVAGADLGRGTAQVQEAIGAVVEHGHGPPALRFGFGLVQHRWLLPEPGCGGNCAP